MAEDATHESDGRRAHRDVKAELDERRIARGVAIGLPLVTVTLTLVVGVTLGAPMAILVLAAGMLMGVIALFWASLRILSGDAALSPELEALDATAHAVDALASRKKMLLRALKDLDNERALGKLEDEDYEQLSHTYRGELKDVLGRIDASLEPHRPKAEDAARAYLAKVGLAEEGYRGTLARETPEVPEVPEAEESEPEPVVEKTAAKTKKEAAPRVACPKCETSNEVDASFCKKCGASLAKKEDAVAEATDAKAKDEASDEA
ncbi:MAG: hypothetical protein JWP87_3908 [Labilithrix sp.]|nr:hypothetical protein [Labilithrix sp.]